MTYALPMPAPVRRTRQHTVGVDDELWSDCLAIAAERRERLSAVVRAALVDYRERHRAILDSQNGGSSVGDGAAGGADPHGSS